MVAFRFTFILCAAVFYTCAHASSLQVPQAKRLEDPASDVLALLAQLKAIVGNAIQDALRVIFGFIDQLEKAATAVVDAARKALEAAIDPFLDEIKKLEDLAAEAAVDLTMCIGTSVDDIKALPEKFLKNVVSCVDNKVTEAKKIINKTISDIESTMDVVTDLENAVNKCDKKSIILQIPCYAEAAAKITADIASIPLKITSDVAQVKLYVLGLIPSLAACSGGVVAALGVDAAKIVAEVTECAMARINGSHVENVKLFP